MAAAAHDSDSDGSWADYPEEDPDRGAALDAEIARMDQLLQERLQNGDWCTCGYCFPPEHAFSAHDVTCCQESQPAREMCNDYQEFGDEMPYPCVTQHPSFYHQCLHERGLNNRAHLYMMPGVDVRMVDRNERLRYIAFRVYIAWTHGRLGRRNRRAIPHCVQKAIRRRFPDPHGRYTGHQPADLADQQPGA